MLHVNLVVFSAGIIVIVFGAPAPIDEVKIDNYFYKSLNDQNNKYQFYYMLSDGQERFEEGSFKTDDKGVEKLVVSGSYDYFGPDGVLYSVFYTADENGFRPYGDHLPGSTESTATPDIAAEMVPSIETNVIKSLIG